jgi:threonine aldolase
MLNSLWLNGKAKLDLNKNTKEDMGMIRFNCDYNEGAHPKVLEKLIQTNMEQTAGYGVDPYCIRAAELIKGKCGTRDADVHFLVGGTQTNLTVISAALRPHQGVIAASSGHINTHESGAIEATGHKVLALQSIDGKLTAGQIQAACDEHKSDESYEHIVQPKLVYISNPTEIGTIYSKAQLSEISETCKKNGLLLYMDGARLGYGLCAEDNDLDLPAIARLCDAFYIGGTKIGALFGEALVICNPDLQKDFRYIMKQKGGMLAKGRLLGLQFIALFEEDLYFHMSAHANKMAMLIKEAFSKKGNDFLINSTTNQQFPIVRNEVLDKLNENFQYSFWQKIDDNRSAVRFCTSWATEISAVEQLITEIEKA